MPGALITIGGTPLNDAESETTRSHRHIGEGAE